MKKCLKCGIEQELSNFSIKNKKTGKLESRCKMCVQKYLAEYYLKNREKLLQYQIEYQQSHKQEIKGYNAAYRQENKIEINKKRAIYRQNNKEKIKTANSNYYLNNKEILKIKSATRYQNNKEKVKSRVAIYAQINKERIKINSANYRSKPEVKKRRVLNDQIRKQTDPFFKLRNRVSGSIRESLKERNGNKGNISCLVYLPYTIAELKRHIENLFESWMNWENWGVYNSKTWNDDDDTTKTWQLDHKIPHSTFHYTSMEDEDFKKCWALSNLRPLSAKQNSIDGATRVRHKKK